MFAFTGLRLAGVALAIAAILGAGWYVHHLRGKAAKVDAAEAERDAARAERDQAIEGLVAGVQAVNQASEGYQRELQEIRDRPVSAEPVRLCKPARVQAAASDTADTRPGGTTSAAGLVRAGDGANHPEGPDIGPDLRAFAKRCEVESAKVRGLQAAPR